MVSLNDGNGIAGLLMEDTVITSQIDGIVGDLKKSSEHITRVLYDVDEILWSIKAIEGVAGAILYDSAMANDLKETMQNINRDRYYSMKIWLPSKRIFSLENTSKSKRGN